jgi:hypothetical protein
MKSRWMMLAILGLAAVGTTSVLAQTGTAPPPPEKPAVAEAPGSGRTLSATEMVAQSKELMSKMQATLQRVVQLQEIARKQKDIIKLNCVNDKLVQVKGNMNVAESATTALHEAIARTDEAQRQHEFTRITLTSQKVQVLGTEAENCIGEDLTFIGQTEVKVEIDPNIPETDPTGDTKPEPVIERPPVASPFN